MKKTFILFLFAILFLFSMSNSALGEDFGQIEVFDIKKGKVIKTLPGSEEIRIEVEKILEGITGIYPNFEPIPKKGQMVKVPLTPPMKLKNQWLDDQITEVIVIFPEHENPHLLVFDQQANSFFFTFDKSVDDFLESIRFTPKAAR